MSNKQTDIEDDRALGNPILSSEQMAAIKKAITIIRQASNQIQKTNKIVAAQPDEAALVDELNRDAFAQILVRQINTLRQKTGDGGFAIHLYGPWGMGKTSTMNIMKKYLASPTRKEMSHAIVYFNAWQHEHRNPPWWPFIENVQKQCRKNFKFYELSSVWLWIYWYWRRFLALFLPIFLATSALFLCLYFGFSAITDSALSQGIAEIIKTLLPGLVTVTTVFGTFIFAAKIIVFGSDKNAKFYHDISHDPFKIVRKLFKKIVDITKKPVCICIDDLDRCNTEFVVSLLEGIQNSFRHKNVIYIITADRTWIRNCFEEKYNKQANNRNILSEPLGYLFLEKIFQISTPLPRMGTQLRQKYFSKILGRGNDLSGANENSSQTHLVARTGNTNRPTETENERNKRIIEKFSSDESDKMQKHFLENFSNIISGNPRTIKRIVNAFLIRSAIHEIEESQFSIEALARWVILEQRFPAISDLLSENPAFAKKIYDEKENVSIDVLRSFPYLSQIIDIISDNANLVLKPDIIKEITEGLRY